MKTAIVIGAGPAGIGAALGLSRKGVSTKIFEKQPQIGKNRRGETIRFHPRMETLLRPGFFEEQTIHKVNKRRYYSHTCKNHVDRQISTWNLIITWPQFIQAMANIAESEGVQIFPGTGVREILSENGRAVGVLLENGESHRADFVVSCSGHEALVNRAERRDKIDIPIYKKIVEDYEGPQERLEYFFQADPTWPAIGTIFPRGNRDAEVIVMFLTDCAAKPAEKWRGLESQIELFEKEHPVFAEQMSGTRIVYETKTAIPMGKIGDKFMYEPGLLVLGDEVGTVQARGGSGIKASFLISYDAAQKAAELFAAGDFPDEKIRQMNRFINESDEMKELKAMNLKFGIPRRAFFHNVTSPASMDTFWFALSFFMR